jgi:phosphoserine phosphatase RsbU/P
LASGAFAFALGDVAGKGPPAALLAAQLQGTLAVQSYSDATPAATVTNVNRVLARRAVGSRFATLVYDVISCDGVLTYCNAGHNPPLLIGRRGVQRLETGGLILGAFSEASFEQDTVPLCPDDTLVVFSDGVTEALNAEGAEFGEERLIACVDANRGLTPRAMVDCLLGSVDRFSMGATPNDDRTALILRFTGM